ncbi:m123R [Myxoma virus]|uniref:M123R n=2 Tax=Myxoma virus TaxID=10273 RepID=Q9Q8H8_MYXVL|nr:hypothetical protein MYXV_gp127 [Myxoma virus]ACB28918.1 m123R [recombinant virus 6918VP60-T2]AAF15011.1 m123R [Myxoma virus]ACB28746.1 m123R [Myxoma virus]ADK63763.1 m123R [Myxoma virus]AFU77055.1 m123R [Myxoma virus]
MDADRITCVTALGVLYIRHDEIDTVRSELGITFIGDVGPYRVATLNICPVALDDVYQRGVTNCYIVSDGRITRCSNQYRLTFPIHKVYTVYKSINSFMLCFDKCFKLRIDNNPQDFFITSSIAIQDARVLEVYNLYKKGDYHLILNPSDAFLNGLVKKYNVCLSSNTGWVIADGKSEIE